MSWTEQDLAAYLNRGKMPGGRCTPAPSRGSTVPKESLAYRGIPFEKTLNAANHSYFESGVAFVYKLPTSSRKIKNRDGQIDLIQIPSPVDYLGTWQGHALALEAKQTQEARWPLSLLEDHQRQFLMDWERGGGIAGVLLHFSRHGRTFWLPVSELLAYSERKVRGGRKSITILELGPPWEVPSTARAEVDYLVTIEAWLKGGRA